MGTTVAIFVRWAHEIWDRRCMKDELVRRALVGVFVGLGIGLSGCNGCSGCEGQTPSASEVERNASAPSSSQAPSAAVVVPQTLVAPSALPSIAPNPEHDPTGVRRCCLAIRDNAATAPAKHQEVWKSAIAACSKAMDKNIGRKALEPVREILTPVGYPAACQ